MMNNMNDLIVKNYSNLELENIETPNLEKLYFFINEPNIKKLVADELMKRDLASYDVVSWDDKTSMKVVPILKNVIEYCFENKIDLTPFIDFKKIEKCDWFIANASNLGKVESVFISGKKYLKAKKNINLLAYDKNK